MAGLPAILDHLAALVEGRVAGAVHPIPADTFLPTDARTPIDTYPVDGATRRYELLWSRVRDGLPDTGETNTSGDIVDAHARLALQVAYHAGGGSADGGDRVGVNRAAAVDWHRLRRALVCPDNYAPETTGIMSVRLEESTVAPASGEVDLVLMTVPILVLYREDWTEEPS